MRTLLVTSLLVLALLPTGDALAQVIEADHLTTTEFAALDRARTAVIVPGGILEQHGPHLPSASFRHDESRREHA
jgi:hypothetical protein